MEPEDSRASNKVLDWPGLHTVFIPRVEAEFGFTLRHFVVYPPPSVLDNTKDDQGSQYQDYNYLSRELSLGPLDTIFVKSVKEGSPAYYAGLNTGDRIIAINGDSVSGKSYQDVITAIQHSSDILKLLVVSKDEDILQMAYQSQAGECMHSSSSYLSNNIRLSGVSSYHPHHQLSHSSSDLVHETEEQGLNSHESLPYDRHEVRHSYPLSQWGFHDFRFKDFSFDLQCHRAEPLKNYSCINQVPTRVANKQQPRFLSQDPGSNMASNVIPSKPKFSFGLYFPPKSSDVITGSSAENLGRRYEDSPKQQVMTKSHTFEVNHRSGAAHREKSLAESSALSSSAKSRDYFIRYSSDKGASDNRNRYSPRHSALDRYSREHQPAYVISRSQTESTISPSKSSSPGQQIRQPSDYVKSGSEYSLNNSRSQRYIPAQSGNKHPRSEENLNTDGVVGGSNQNTLYSEQLDSRSDSKTFKLHIPHEQQTQQSPSVSRSSYIPVRQRYGLTSALTRSPNPAHIEIQKSIGKPIVSQRKYQFESGKNENTSPLGIGGYNRYKTEIEKIRTQPKFSSIAVRKASFEQSPDRDPPGFDDSVELAKQPLDYLISSTETAQPTVKVRKISAERYISGSPHRSGDKLDKSYNTGGNYQDNVPLRILVSAGNINAPSSPISTISGEGANQQFLVESGQSWSKNSKISKDGYFYVPSHGSNTGSTNEGAAGGCDISIGSLSDSGVWVKSYHGSSDMLDSVDGVSAVSDSGMFSVCSSTTDQESNSLHTSRPARKPSYLSAVNAPVQRSSTHSLNSLPSGSAQLSSVVPLVMSASDSAVLLQHSDVSHDSQDAAEPDFGEGANASVIMRKKLHESLEEQASKLHRRTSYLMATARDRTNMIPLEQTFSSPQVITDHSPQHSGSSIQHHSSVKLNKFFGEMIPTIAEGVEMKATDHEEPPEIIRRGPLLCKISVIEGKKCSDRSWKPCYAVLRSTELFLTRDKEGGSASSNFEDQYIPLKLCMVEFARDYAKKKKYVFRMSTHNECEYLFQTEDRGTLMCWIQGIKSINEPMKAEKMDELLTAEKEKLMQASIETSMTPNSKMSPQLGHKGKKLSALSFKSKLTSSPSMKRKKPNAAEKDKDESIKKGWMDRIPMMKSLKKHNEDSSILSLGEQNVDTDKFQFGVPLEDCFPSPHNEYVPLIVELCTRIVEARGLEVVGVYRVPGNSAAINALTEEFNRGIDSVNIDNEKLLDINVISSLLKSFFRKLPEPLIPADTYDAFIEANRCPDEDKRKLKIKRLLHILPPHHNETFKHMAEHLNKVASYGNINKMDAKNLAIMFGPTLVRKKGDDTVSLVTDMSDQCRIVESIILHHDWFFSPWDQDNYIPMETTVETVPVDENQAGSKDDDEEADSAINTKEIISSIVGAASKKLRQQQQQKSLESLDIVDSCSTISTSTYKDHSSSDSNHMTSLAKSLTSITSSLYDSEEYMSSVPSTRYLDMLKAGSSSELDFKDLASADTKSSVSSSLPKHFSDDFLQDKNDELEISHGLSTSVSRDAINRLKRIGDDVTALLHTFEQKQLKERELRRREQEMVEREHFRTQLELEQEENHSVEDWLLWKGSMTSTRMPDLVSSSYIMEKVPYDQNPSNLVSVSQKNNEKQDIKIAQRKDNQTKKSSGYMMTNVESITSHKNALSPSIARTVHQSRMSRGGSQEDILSQCNNLGQNAAMPVVMRGPSERRLQENPQKTMHLAVGGVTHRPASIRSSLGRRHGSLDSLIDMIDKQDKRSSWASSDSEDGSDLLTSITTTFDQKLQILLNPRYKLTGSGKRNSKNEAPKSTNEVPFDRESLLPNENFQSRPPAMNTKQVYTVAALLDSVGSFRDPSLHRSARSDPKIGIASRFEQTDKGRATSTSPVTTTSSDTATKLGQHHKNHYSDVKTFLGKPASQSRDLNSVNLTKPKRLESNTNRTSTVNSRYEQRKIYKTRKAERNQNLSRVNKEENIFLRGISSVGGNRLKEESVGTRKFGRKQSYRRHTIAGMEDLAHIIALSQGYSNASLSVGRDKLSAWEQLQPAVTDPDTPRTRSMQAWIQRERLRGSTPDLSYHGKE